MRVTVLEISALLENVTNIHVGSTYNFHIKFKCNNCDTQTENYLTFSEDDKVPLMGGRSYVNLIFKCKTCSRPSNVSIVKGSMRPYMNEDSPNFKPFIELDCRGCDPVSFQPSYGFECSNIENSSSFENIDLSEREWAEYDEKTQESVSIYDFKHRFVTVKK